jgi:molybdopterin molybdotransferase
MPTFEEARSIILKSVAPLGIERVALLNSIGRVIAEEMIAPWEMPAFDNSAMDGFAVRSSDCQSPTILKITGYIPAGGVATTDLEPGSAIRIMTGAPVPMGCDAVVPFEETEEG